MKDGLSMFKTWAPDDALWTDWAKPVLFAGLPVREQCNMTLPQVDYINAAGARTMLVVDLPGVESVAEGLALAGRGYRPVPLYNGVDCLRFYTPIVNVRGLAAALEQGARMLETMKIRTDASPAFLLDSNRMSGGGVGPGKFDNRWCVFAQDMPSAPFLLGRGIDNVIVRAARIQDDLSHILLRYQQSGIQISLCQADGIPRTVTVTRPSRFRSLMYRFQVILGLRRNATGGFGAVIPEPTTHSTGHHYHRYG